MEFDGLKGLTDVLSADPRVDACTVQRFYSYALGHQVQEADQRALLDLEQDYETASGDFSSLVRSIILHEAFLFASEPEQ